MSDEITPKQIVTSGTVGLTVLVLLIFGSAAGCRSYDRYQKVQDVKNQTETTRIDTENKTRAAQLRAKSEAEVARIQISTQKQRVLIAEQQAEIRLKEAQGVKAAQDEIAKTITPLYVQLEMVKQLGEIAKSGKNSSVVYIPIGPDGLPVVAPVKK